MRARALEDRRCAARGDEGSALAFVLIIAAALLFVAAIGMHVGLGGRRSATQGKEGKEAFWCAEKGLEQGRVIVGANFRNAGELATILSGGTTSWYDASTGVIVTDNTCTNQYTFRVTIRDDIDEIPPAADTPTSDSNMRVFVESEALRSGIAQAKISVLLGTPAGMMGDYIKQSREGAGKTGNKPLPP